MLPSWIAQCRTITQDFRADWTGLFASKFRDFARVGGGSEIEAKPVLSCLSPIFIYSEYAHTGILWINLPSYELCRRIYLNQPEDPGLNIGSHAGEVSCMEFSRELGALVTGGWDGNVHIW